MCGPVPGSHAKDGFIQDIFLIEAPSQRENWPSYMSTKGLFVNNFSRVDPEIARYGVPIAW